MIDELPEPDDNVSRRTRTNWAQWIIALAAIGLSVWEGLENRHHNRLEVIPQLEFARSLTTGQDEVLEVTFENTGLGPAKVNWIAMASGRPAQASDSAAVGAIYTMLRDSLTAAGYDNTTSEIGAGSFVPPERMMTLFRARRQIEEDSA